MKKTRFHIAFSASYPSRIKTLTLLWFFLLPLCSFAAVITVPGDYATIQAAIDAATDGDEIIVSPDTYYENIHFLGKNIILRSTEPTSPTVVASTVIDGNNYGSVGTFSGTELTTCVLSGFTITNGQAVEGGGIYGNGTLATIQNNIINGNTAQDGGGGFAGCDGTIRNNTISGNSATGTYGSGGGLHDCHGTIQNNTISGNLALSSGGGGLEWCNGVIQNNTILNNMAEYGGGLCSCEGTILNNAIYGNAAQEDGGGFAICGGIILNCIIWGNTALYEGAQIYHSNNPLYSCIQDWSGGGVGNISANPQFVNPAGGDFHLQSNSPCIDAGNYAYLFGEYILDIDGEARFADNSVDMGIDEYASSPDSDGDLLSDSEEAARGTDPNRSDTDGDGLIDGVEILRGTNPTVANTPPGISIPSHYPTIQHGIFFAFPHEVVTVSPGTYNEIIHFLGKDITLTSTDSQDSGIRDSTIIDGNNWTSVVYFKGTEKGNCFLSGFTITNGYGLFGGGIMGNNTRATIEYNNIQNNTADRFGGGLIWCHGTIIDNIIRNNTAMEVGGGLARCYATIENNTISSNTAIGNLILPGCGGGLWQCYDATIQNNIICGNSADEGGGLSSCYGTIQNNIISDNLSGGNGGGFCWCGGTIQNNTISGNSAAYSGGGLYSCIDIVQNNIIRHNSANQGGGLYWCDGTIQDNLIEGNTAELGGGGITGCYGLIQNNIIHNNSAKDGGGLFWCQMGTLRNNIISCNSADNNGGGLASYGGTIQNNTIYGNSANSRGGGLLGCYGTITNCIIWQNSASTGVQLDACSTPTYSCIQDWTGGTGNISSEPQLVDPTGGDFHLRPNSPCIDAGCFIDGLTQDFEGDPRPWDGTGEPRGDGSDFDIGADEFTIKTTLAVFSEYDTPVPPVGINYLTSGTLINAYMTEPVVCESGTQYLCTGWGGEGAVPASGSTTSFTFVLDQPSTITWLWQIQAYYLNATANPAQGGSVTLLDGVTPATGWYNVGEVVTVLAVPEFDYQFDYWSGDLSGSNNPEAITINSPQSITANFSPVPTPTPTPTPCVIYVPQDYLTIQAAIDAAHDGCEIIVSPDTYYENINFLGKNIILRSTDPTSPTVVASTIIDGRSTDSVVTFSGTELTTCVLSGFTITNGIRGINGYGSISTIQNNTISYNSAMAGAALYFCNGTIRNNTITSNTASWAGGALYRCNGAIENNAIWSNFANSIGGGLYRCDGNIQNNIIFSNLASNRGGGLYGCDGNIVNNTIYGNTASSGGGLYQTLGIIQNCIIWQNTAPSDAQLYNCSIPSYSCIQNWPSGGTGNFPFDPELVDPANGNFHLQLTSPCIDAGGNVSNLTQDFEGDPRPYDAASDPRGDGSDFDIGADEFIGVAPTLTPTPTPIPTPCVITVPGDYPTIQGAIDAAHDSCEIIVAPDTYYENINFLGKNIILRSTEPTNSSIITSTIIDGRSSDSVVTFSGTELTTCVLSGFTITNGYAPKGGGIYGNGSLATIQHNNITTNSAIGWSDGDGGGIYDCDGIIQNNAIYGNQAWAIGYFDTLGGGLAKCDGIIQSNTISYNWVIGDAVLGAGLYNCNGIIQNNIIYGNSVDFYAYISYGGGLEYCNGTIQNNIIAGNQAQYGGGLDWCIGTIRNNIIFGNSAEYGGGLSDCHGTIRNCIIWQNTASSGAQIAYSAEPFYCCIQDWTGDGTGNISYNPQLVDPASGDFHLLFSSPCIDAGGTVTLAQDFEGDPRPYDAVTWESRGDGSDFDIGADEFIGIVPTPTPTPTPTVTPTTTPTPTATPTATPSPTPTATPTGCMPIPVDTWTFEPPPQGWSYRTAVPLPDIPSWDHVTSLTMPDALGLTAPVEETTDYYASWDNYSGDPSTPAVAWAPNSVWRAIFTMSTDKAEPNTVPSIRLRMVENHMKATSYIRVYPGGWLPLEQRGSGTTDYTLYLRPPVEDNGFFLAFDLIDFRPVPFGVACDGTVYLEEVSVDRFDLGDSCFDSLWADVRSYSSTELHSWGHSSAGVDYLTDINGYSWPTDGLEQNTALAQTRAFGAWVSPIDEIELVPDQFYRAVWTLACEDSTVVATIRMRLHTSDYRYASYMTINRDPSDPANSALPPITGKDYYLYAEFPAVANVDNLLLAWDLYDFDPLAGGWAKLTEVSVSRRDLP